MIRFQRSLIPLAFVLALPTLASAQAFVGSDNFSGGDTKWAYYTRPAGGTNGTLAFTGSVLEFTKASGAGSYILGWDGDGNSANTVYRTVATYNTSWVMNVTATNLAVAETGKFTSVGFEAAAGAGAYTGLFLSNIDGQRYVVAESNAIGRNVRVLAPIGADVRLRLAWDAIGRKFIASYSFDGGVSFKTLATTAVTVWPTSPASTGMYLELVSYATSAAAVPSGQMRLDDFSVAAVTGFTGSDDFSGNDSKWAFSYRLGYLTDGTNGASRFTGSVLEFTKGAGKGSYFIAWDGDGIADNPTSRIPASYTTNWVAELSATNKTRPESGTFASVGLQLEVGPGSYAEINITTTATGAAVRVEADTPDDPGAITVPAVTDTNVRLRAAWNAATRQLTFSYSYDGTNYNVLRTVGVNNWTTQPTGGFYFEPEAFSTSANPVGAGQMYVDNFSITAAPQSTAAPAPLSVAPGTIALLSAPVTDSASATIQWQRNGANLTGATSESLAIENAQPVNTGVYQAQVTNVAATVTTPATILGLSTTTKVVGTASEVGPNITHANGNVYDQLLLDGAAASITADSGQIVRMSFIDSTNDIVQLEYFGAGTVSLVLDGAVGPALPVNYNQGVTYMKGHAGIVVTDADETSNLSVFSVGRANAVNQSLFKDDVTYDGFADVGFIAISSKNGKFGGLRTANVSYFATKGLTGVYAPGVQFTGPVYVGDINAFDAATPVLMIGSGTTTQINGGDLLQTNGRAIQVSGLARLEFVAGSTSHGALLAAKVNKGKLEQDGVDVTTQVVVGP
jgi:hypothetical protein